MAASSDDLIAHALHRIGESGAPSDLTRVRAMLNDLLGADARNLRREVTLVVAAVDEGVPTALASAPAASRSSDQQQLARRLSTERGLTDEAVH